jgi:hypothetical protein
MEENVDEYEAKGAALKGWASSTELRRIRMERLWRKCVALDLSPSGVAGFLVSAFAPSTALTYAAVLTKATPLGKNEQWLLKYRAIRLWAAKKEQQVRATQAQPLSPYQCRQFLLRRDEPPETRATVLLLWLLAARHGDLQYMHAKAHSEDVLEIRMFGGKSDIFSLHRESKWVRTTAGWGRIFTEMLAKQKWQVYAEILKALKRLQPNLSVHSIRRGAISALATRWSPHQIALLSGHANPQQRLGSLKYIEMKPSQTQPKLVLEMSDFLWEEVRTATSDKVEHAESNPGVPQRAVATSFRVTPTEGSQAFLLGSAPQRGGSTEWLSWGSAPNGERQQRQIQRSNTPPTKASGRRLRDVTPTPPRRTDVVGSPRSVSVGPTPAGMTLRSGKIVKR